MEQEDSKFNISDTKGLLNPFNQVNSVMEKVFVNTKNHGLSIQELWDQINKIKESIGINKTKDGICLSSKSIPTIHDENPPAKPLGRRKDQDKNNMNMNKGIKNLKEQQDLAADVEPSQEFAPDPDINLLLNKNTDVKIDKIIELINSQNKKIDTLESRVSYLGNRSEDKFETLESEMKTLTKIRLDDIENIVKNLQNEFERHKESQKEKDYNMRNYLNEKTKDIEVSIRGLKRRIATGSMENTQEQPKILDSLKKEEIKSEKEENSQDILDKNTLVNHSRSPKKENYQNSEGIVMLWEEIENLRSKFDNFVHCDDFDDLADNVDDIRDKLQQISKEGNFNGEVKDRLENQFSESERFTPENSQRENNLAKGSSNSIGEMKDSPKSLSNALPDKNLKILSQE